MDSLRKSTIKTILCLALFAGLAGYYLLDSRSAARTAAAEAEKDKILDHGFEDCTRIRVRPADSEGAFEILKDEASATGWTIQSALIPGALADAGRAAELAEGMFGLAPLRVIIEQAKAEELAEFGLEPGKALSLEFGLKTGKAVCFLGADNPTGTAVYFRVAGDGRVFMVPALVRSEAERGADYFRERNLLHFNAQSVKSVEITQGKDSVRLVREKHVWRFDPPEEDEALRVDGEKVMRCLSDLTLYATEGFEDRPSAEALESLETPALKIEIGMDSGAAKTLVMGGTIKGKNVKRLVRTSEAEGYLLHANPDFMDKFAHNRDFFVSRKAVPFDPWEIGTARIDAQSRQALLERKDFKWVAAAPESASGREFNFGEFLWTLSETQYKEIAAAEPEGLAPTATLVLRDKDGGPELPRIEFLLSPAAEEDKNAQADGQNRWIRFNGRLFKVGPEAQQKLALITAELFPAADDSAA